MGFSDKKVGGKGKKTNFFAAWDDTDQIDIDYTTDIVIAETGPQGTFDLLAEREYETLMDYPNSDSPDRKKPKLEAYEKQQQNNNFVFNFENYIKRQAEEEELELERQRAEFSGSDDEDDDQGNSESENE